MCLIRGGTLPDGWGVPDSKLAPTSLASLAQTLLVSIQALPEKLSLSSFEGGCMPSLQMKRDLSALCYEHHIEMRFGQVAVQTRGERTQILAYTCPEPDCLIHYHASRGYFITDQNGNGNKLEMTPNVRCPHDGASMYLAEVLPEHKSFRLWKCPQCNINHSNGDNL